MNYLIFVPARKGSKGILNKNLTLLKDKPLLYYTFSFIKKIKNIDKEIFVSTDSRRILKYSKSNGFKYNYLRPKKLSQDNSLVQYAIIDSLEWLKKNYDKKFDAVILLQPTSPIRISKEINKQAGSAIKERLRFDLRNTNADENLIAQLTSPVKWTQSIQKMAADGAKNFIELGPGKVLQGLTRKINGNVEASSLSS